MSFPRLLVVFGLPLLAACGEASAAAPLLPEFPVATPTRGATFERAYVGQVQAVRYVEFRARHRGVVEALGADEGQRVKSGQLLFQIGVRELQQDLAKARAAVESAQAELKAAQLEVANTRRLVEKQVLSATELELGEARLGALTAKLHEAKADEGRAAVLLSWGQVRAPFEGVINRLQRRVGSLVQEEDLLTTLADTSEVYVYFRVSEQEYYALTAQPEQGPREVSLLLGNGAPYPSKGTIDAVESEFDRATGSIAFRARFPNPDGVLKHGASGKVLIRREAPDALVVPQRATFEVQENVYLYTVDAEDVVHATGIVPLARLEQGFVLERGLGPGDRFVLEGVQKLKSGMRITPRPAPDAP
jgi:membrane fusion protein (multidrug efflux system)